MRYSFEEILPVVIWLSEKYTRKESTSIPYETAQQLLGAVCYCIEEWERGEEEISPAEKNLPERHFTEKQPSAQEAYERGYQMVVRKTMEAKDMYAKLIEDFLNGGSEVTDECLVRKIPKFFLHYDPRFFPQAKLSWLAGPDIVLDETLSGVDQVYEYLRQFAI